MMPLALEVYNRGLPPRYNSSVHSVHANLAVEEFRKSTGYKGATCRKAERKLIEQCKKIWNGGLEKQAPSRELAESSGKGRKGGAVLADRRLCDSVSLSGRPCVLLYRACLGKGRENSKVVDLSKCSSGTEERLACLCGRSVVTRSDPFEVQVANFSSLVAPCCTASVNLFPGNKLDPADTSILEDLPPAVASNEDPNKAAVSPVGKRRRKKVAGSAWMVHKLGPSSSYSADLGVSWPGFIPGYNRLEAWRNSILVGLEYECVETGARQFFAVSSLASPVQAYNIVDDSRALWPEFDVDVFLATDKGVTVLQRAFICIGSESPRVTVQARVHFDSEQFTHRPVQLVPNSFVSLSFPHAYSNQQGVISKQDQAMRSTAQPFRSAARLRAGLLSFERL